MADEKLAISSFAGESRKLPPPKESVERAHIKSLEQYREMYERSLNDPDGFWLEQAEILDWFKKPTKAREYIWNTASRKIDVKWFADGELNVSYNCLDRHLKNGLADKVALIWQGEPDEDVKKFTYRELHRLVSRFANVLKKKGIKRGDRVCIYLPMIPELAIAMLACTRIGAIHSIVFGGFSAEALRDRINDSKCRILITSDASLRGSKVIPLKDSADKACEETPSIEAIIVVKRVGKEIVMVEGRDTWWHNEIEADDISDECEPEHMNAEDPLFILYTSGSTGKPKGVLHITGGYLLHCTFSHKVIFDIHDDDIFWCTADIGWITGHSYIVYGPLAGGATSMMFEGVPTYPDPGRFWQICEKFKATVFYTAPTAIRALMRHGEEWPKKYDLSSLRVLGTVGEPINPEAWMWYYDVIGGSRIPVVDTWWQTETGGILITPLPGAHTLKPGSASLPFFGVEPIILRDDGTECKVNEGGKLCIKKPWPGMMRTLYGDHERFIDTYFTMFPDVYFTGDGCRIDKDGDYWLMGRIDDVVNISGHRIGTAEVESALVSHSAVAESAVVAFPHEIKGQGLYAYVTTVKGIEPSDDLKGVLVKHVAKEIGPIAKPDKIQFTDALPKTRSGKIMRRILRKIAENAYEDLGDISTLADPDVVQKLIEGRV